MTPGEKIRREMNARGWTQRELAKVLGKTVAAVNEILQGKRAVTPEMAVALSGAFGVDAAEWLNLEAAFRLSLIDGGADDVARRARLFDLAPVLDLQKRGWLLPGDNPDLIEKDLLGFLEISGVDEEPKLQASMRKAAPNQPLSVSQRAWCFRVRQLARKMLVAKFDESKLPECEGQLRKAAAYSQETNKVPAILAKHGIRFLIVENLPGGKIDGMADWLDPQSPVIALSLRFDRVDSFWFTLFHEFAHIREKDAFSLDVETADPAALHLDVRPAVERRADEAAATMLIPPEEMGSFIRRVGPLYSKERINQFANRLKIHPGVIVGQLQKRGEIGYAANREMLVKIRHIVTPASLTDGWGHTIDPRAVL